MEASGSLGPAESGASEAQTADQQQAPERDSGSQLAEKFDGFLNDFGEWRGSIDQRLEALTAPPDEGEEQEEEAPFSPDEFFQEDGSITPEDLQQWIDQAAEKKAQQFLSPIQQQVQQAQAQAEQRRLEQGADELEQKYPILGDEEYQERFIQTAQQQAMALAQAVGNPELAEVLWKQPEFMENVHLAIQARERAENEVPAGSENGMELERGNSLGPTGSGLSNDDIVQRIANARG
jgi:hypothetical protein